MDGEIEFDDEGRVFLVEQFPNADGSTHERKIFLLQVSKKGELLMDGKIIDRVQPFPMCYGSGTIRDGKFVFNDIRQHPTIKRTKATVAQPSVEPPAQEIASSESEGGTPGATST